VDYDTNLKVYPPLRDQVAVKALHKAILDGTVDCITSHHQPHEYDSKIIEFEYAKPGMSGLETVYAAIRTILPELKEEKLVALLSNNPRKIFGMEQPTIESGNPCSLTLFDPSGSTLVKESNLRSKSKNTAFMGRELRGSITGIINGGKISLND
jgi:dihydroorotase